MSIRSPVRKGSTRLAISLPGELARRVERLRRESGVSRSALVRQALERILADREKAARIKAYVEGYRRTPETVEDAGVSVEAIASWWAEEPWE